MKSKSSRPISPVPAPSGCAVRPGAPRLKQLAHAAEAWADASPLAGLGRLAQDSAPVQRKVTIGGKPVERRTPTKWRLRDADTDMPSSGDQDKYYADDWDRTFRDMEQFRAYSEKSAPVAVGLIEPYLAWYDIPYIEQGTFFVLGENHGAFGYRDLAKESNITGNVLGEGGAHGFMNTPEKLQKNLGSGVLKDDRQESREYLMESIAPKAYYSANVAVYELEKEAGKSKPAAGDGIKRGTEVASDWLLNYKYSERGFDPVRLKPYYVEAGTGKRVFMAAETTAGPYNRFKTARGMLDGFRTRLAVYLEANPEHEKKDAFGTLDSKIALLLTELDKEKHERNADEALKLARFVRSALRHVSAMEDNDLHERHDEDPPTTHAATNPSEDKPKSYEDHEKIANVYRERAMYQAILKARDEKFAFSGIGDNHAVNLKASLSAVGITIITLDDLIKTYSKPAR